MALRFLACLLLVWTCVRVPPAQAAPPPSFAACEALLEAGPEGESAAKCLYEASFGSGREEALRRMRHLRSLHPHNPWFGLYLGHLLWQEPEKAEPLYQEAAREFASRREAAGEVLARASLYHILFSSGRTAEAGRETERARRVAEGSGDAATLARARLLQARYLTSLGEDLEQARLLLRQVDADVFPDGSYSLQRDCLLGLGNVALSTGRLDEAREAFRRYVELAAGAGDRYAEASALYNLARTRLEAMTDLPRPQEREEVRAVAERALAAAEDSQNRAVEAQSHLLLGMLATGAAARAHLERCLALANAPRDRCHCLGSLARLVSHKDPARGQALLDEGFALAQQAGDPWSRAHLWRERMNALWMTGPSDRAIADSLAILDTLEALRDLPEVSASRPTLLSAWTEDPAWLSGHLLEAHASGRFPQALAQAFAVTERQRSRALIDALEAARAAPNATGTAAALQTRRAELLEQIAGVQRRLFEPGLAPEGRRELERLETEEAAVRVRIARAAPAFAAMRRRDFAGLDQVRRALAPDEALLSYQIAPWKDWVGDFGGGAWLIAVTRGGARVYRVPLDRAALRPAVRLLAGLILHRDGSEATAAIRLHSALLAPALADLPPEVRRLVIVPDDDLHRLPFGALRPSAAGKPLVERYEVSQVPSATLWLRWRSLEAAERKPALVLADPTLPASSAAFRLGPLPEAKREGRAALRHLAAGRLSGGELKTGGDASEAFLKGVEPGRFGVVHFATHAVLDGENAERSSVWLASGADTEDGLLQMREIADLRLGSPVLVLSSCRGASGTVLRGEGTMSLARAFFQAGSPAVVASLWPLRDDDAAALFDRFYRRLGEGRSVASALRAAQLDRLAEGAPAESWAGLVVLGDGNRVPVPGGHAWLPPRDLLAGAVLLTLGGLLAARLRGSARRDRRERSTLNDIR